MKKCNVIDDISIKMMSTDLNYHPDIDDSTIIELIRPISDIREKIL